MSSYGWDKKGFNEQKCIDFINQHPQFTDMLVRLFETTEYVTAVEVIKGLRTLIQQWLSERDSSLKLIVMVDSNNDIGSEQWIYQQVKDLLPPHITVDKESFTDSNVELVMFDDWCLSGINMISTVDDKYFNLKQQELKIPTKTTFIIHIGTDRCFNVLNSLSGTTVSIYYTKLIKSLNAYIDDIPEQNAIEFMKTFSPDLDPELEQMQFPIHLEYKVANQFGSFPQIYNACRDGAVKPYKSKEK